MKKLKILLLTTAVILLTACGGGSSVYSPPIVDTPTIVVKFLDQLKPERYFSDDVDVNITYDENNNRLTEFAEYNGDDITLYWWYSSDYTYDFDSMTATETWETDLGTIGENIFIYDESGIILEVSGYYRYPSTFYDRTFYGFYSYDTFGNLITFENTTLNGDISVTIINTYDTDRNLIKKEKIILDNAYRSNLIETFDSNGNPLSSEFQDSEGNSRTTTWTYDEDGILIKKTYYSINSADTIYNYIEIYIDGVLREKTTYSSDHTGDWTKCVYTYDENGELIDSICTSG